jgi:hypothetical protein
MSSKARLKALLALVLFALGALGAYALLSYRLQGPRELKPPPAPEAGQDVAVFYPVGTTLRMQQRRIPATSDRLELAQAVLREFLKGPAGLTEESHVPREVKVLGLYFGTHGVLYVEFSHELKRNFQGDALAEFLLLRALYETLRANIKDMADMKLLVEGQEVESLGGHFYAHRRLGSWVRMQGP